MKEEGTRLSQISISVPAVGTFLVLCPWTRLAQATVMALKFKVTIELEGVPAHAWSVDTAAKILAPSC